MCLAVIAVDAHPRHAVVVAANRDEFHARDAQRAHWWNDDDGSALLAGRDLRQGGTWLGVNRQGRWAFVTNVREPGRNDASAPSRGALVPLVLRDVRDCATAVERIAAQSAAYNGFNLVGGERMSATFASNRASAVRTLPRGVSGLSNAGLDTPWPKLLRTKAGVVAWARGSGELDELFDVLNDRAIANDDALPDTGLTRERERLLSSPFIISRDYGTRCSTVLALGRDATVHFLERSFNAAGEVTGDVVHRFRIEATQPALG